MAALFDAQLKSGIETVLDTVGFDDKIASADIIFTGEGRLDSQSADGKVISGVAKRAKKKNIPVIAVVGGYDENLKAVYDMGVTAVFATNREPVSFEKIKGRSKENLALTVDNILRIIKW
jgi:glycerate kinase